MWGEREGPGLFRLDLGCLGAVPSWSWLSSSLISWSSSLAILVFWAFGLGLYLGFCRLGLSLSWVMTVLVLVEAVSIIGSKLVC